MNTVIEIHPKDEFLSSDFIDWPGVWYELNREKGEFDKISFSSINLKTGERTDYTCSHQRTDGLGGFSYLMRKLGYSFELLSSPKDRVGPGLLERIKLFFGVLLASFAKSKLDWERFDQKKCKSENSRYAYFFLNKELSSDFKNYAKKKKVTVNAIILSILNRKISSQYLKKVSKNRWIYPVSMRSCVQLESAVANCSSALPLDLAENESAVEIVEQIRDKLRKNLHWGVWSLLNIGKVIGKRGMRWMLSKRNHVSAQLGTFSSMGEWAVFSKEGVELDSVWMATPPGTANYPVSMATMFTNGRLSVTLKIHPVICRDPKHPDQMIQNIRDEIVSLVKGSPC